MAKTTEDLKNKIDAADSQQQQALERQKSPMAQLLQRYEGNISKILPENMTMDRFEGLCLTAVMDQPGLTQCLATQKGVLTVVQSVCRVASLGLEPGSHLGQCWILPSRNRQRDGSYVHEAHVEIGFQGYKDLMYRSGLVSFVDGETVYKEDDFKYSKGTGSNNFFMHKLYADGDPGESIAWWVKVLMRDGSEFFKVLHRWHVENRHMKFTRARNRNGEVVGPWKDFFDEMALKSVVIEMRKLMPRSIQNQILPAYQAEQPMPPMLEASTPIETGFTSLSGFEMPAEEASKTEPAEGPPNPGRGRTRQPRQTQPAPEPEPEQEPEEDDIPDPPIPEMVSQPPTETRKNPAADDVWSLALTGGAFDPFHTGVRELIIKTVYAANSLEDLRRSTPEAIEEGAAAVQYLADLVREGNMPFDIVDEQVPPWMPEWMRNEKFEFFKRQAQEDAG